MKGHTPCCHHEILPDSVLTIEKSSLATATFWSIPAIGTVDVHPFEEKKQHPQQAGMNVPESANIPPIASECVMRNAIFKSDVPHLFAIEI